MDVKVEIMQRIDNLPLEAQRTLLESLGALTGERPKGKPGSAVLAYPGRLDDEVAAEMIAAIEEGCGTVVPTGVNRTMSAERLARITIEESKCGGRPCVRGLRIRVSDILAPGRSQRAHDTLRLPPRIGTCQMPRPALVWRWSQGMLVVVQLAAQHRHPPKSLHELLRPFHAELRAMHPDTSDPTLRTFYYVDCESAETARRVAELLIHDAAVDAAYVKPAEALP